MDARSWAADNLAAKLLAGPWVPATLAAAIEAELGPGSKRTRGRLIGSLIALGREAYPPAPHRLAAHLRASKHFIVPRGRSVAAALDAPRFTPAESLAGLDIPILATSGDLADWLDLSIEQLDWLSDEKRTHGSTTREPLQHYRYTFLPKHSGPPRLIEAPKPRLKAIQRRILDEILAPVPVHDCAYGFVAGRSCLGGAQIHAGEALVACFDLANFFPSLGAARIHGIFRTLGYPWAVARHLTGLCSTATPPAMFRNAPAPEGLDRVTRALYANRHLPQGSPASPALANLAAWRLDRRLHGLARAAGANYTRYADDLAFSGDSAFAGRIVGFQRGVEHIVREEGFAVNGAKTRLMRRGTSQRVTGVVVNEHCNIGRAEFDTLKAILHNCTRLEPAGQNRAGVPDFRRHLEGRVAWVEQVNPARGVKLRAVFERVVWA
jgi:RNA-directed DNA polymerase